MLSMLLPAAPTSRAECYAFCLYSKKLSNRCTPSTPQQCTQHKSASIPESPYFPFGELYWALFQVLSNPLGCWSQDRISTCSKNLLRSSRSQATTNQVFCPKTERKNNYNNRNPSQRAATKHKGALTSGFCGCICSS